MHRERFVCVVSWGIAKKCAKARTITTMRAFVHTFTWLLDVIFGTDTLEQSIRTRPPEDFAALVHIKEHDGITSLLSYRDPLIRKAIWMLKYRDSSAAARALAACLESFFLEELADIAIFDDVEVFFVPIPLTPKRLRKRGYNQVERVLREMNGEYRVERVLKKVRETKPQTRLERSERLVNLNGAFAVINPEIISGKHIFLIDDVTTTGSTLREARKTLTDAGARQVTCIALARA
ncbi:hypothetical protein COU17_02540 [Candidatus Kaiserbacteria bacterium CG10_big_fil_rev_8_21_14_0_10_49_17]|uniref:Phosphoribosyltransferase domain-containing protein n=1 Tax=Candidatus Kaiserbacteria bacterium CG10_big_fil_rev_8_21_14_0_10_49_17 TaxID=1974609 RepID=A0A2M6WE16_9BACT|nr:MAG: hypothetical protein COU17_02540 [Candidatus Kaiserbacteria bacterium CG10_big_fil_rev_8_21_14_0_10_49_17]